MFAPMNTMTMNTEKTPKVNWWKVAGAVLLTHIILIGLSFLEVAFYSYLINPGQEEKVYQAHAETMGPWISSVFGVIFIYLFVYRLTRRKTTNPYLVAIVLVTGYAITDM